MEFKESSSATPVLFPSLELLQLRYVTKLTELWKMDLLAEQGSSFPYLSELYMDECFDLASLHLPPSLSRLQINGCKKLASLELPSSSSLSILRIYNCSNLASLELPSSSSLSILDINKCSNLASLKLPSYSIFVLKINKCSNLASLTLPSSSSLFELVIYDCSNLASLELPSSFSLSRLLIRNCSNLESLGLPSSNGLFELRIIDCPILESVNVASLTSLEELTLRGVRAEVLRQLIFVSSSSSLKSLFIWEIDGMIANLEEEPEVQLLYVSTLETLYIRKCTGLTTLQHWMGNLSLLTELVIYDYPELTTLPEHIYSHEKLQKLYLCDCPHLEQRYNKETGEDRAKIAHIPHVYFRLEGSMKWKVRNP